MRLILYCVNDNGKIIKTKTRRCLPPYSFKNEFTLTVRPVLNYNYVKERTNRVFDKGLKRFVNNLFLDNEKYKYFFIFFFNRLFPVSYYQYKQ